MTRLELVCNSTTQHRPSEAEAMEGCLPQVVGTAVELFGAKEGAAREG